MNSNYFFLFVALIAIAGGARAQNYCRDNSIENNLILVTSDMLSFDSQTNPLLCPRSQNEFWKNYGGNGSACWKAMLDDGWDCMLAAAVYSGATGCRDCVDGLGVYQCPSTCSDVNKKCAKAVAIGNCFSGQAEAQCFGESGACSKWSVDKDVLEAQTGLSRGDDGGDGNSAGDLVGAGASLICAAVFVFLLAHPLR